LKNKTLRQAQQRIGEDSSGGLLSRLLSSRQAQQRIGEDSSGGLLSRLLSRIAQQIAQQQTGSAAHW
jgi:hypothetical protein